MSRQERVEAMAAGGDSRVDSRTGQCRVRDHRGCAPKGYAMQLGGFSRFPVGDRVAPTGRNLVAGAENPVPVRPSVKLTAAKAVKDAVNGS